MRRVLVVCALFLSLLAVGSATTAPLAITTTALPAATIGQAYNVQLTATGGVQPYTWSSANMPAGLSMNQNTGVLSGAPYATDKVGVHNVGVTVKCAGTKSATKVFVLLINKSSGGGTLTITTNSLPEAMIGGTYSFQLTAVYGVPPYRWTVSGLPSGLTCSAAGLISGVVAKGDSVGAYALTIKVTDSASTHAVMVVK